MLQVTPPTTFERSVRLKVSRPHRTITGQALAKTPNREPRERAYQAARWVRGSLTINNPTLRMAAQTFGVCEALIRQAIRELEGTTFAPPPIDWTGRSDADRDAFVGANLIDLWDRIDRLTR